MNTYIFEKYWVSGFWFSEDYFYWPISFNLMVYGDKFIVKPEVRQLCVNKRSDIFIPSEQRALYVR